MEEENGEEKIRFSFDFHVEEHMSVCSCSNKWIFHSTEIGHNFSEKIKSFRV